MKTENNLFPRVAAFGNLMRAFVQASRGKRDQPAVQRFEYHLEERLWEIKGELEAEAYHRARGAPDLRPRGRPLESGPRPAHGGRPRLSRCIGYCT